MKSPRLFFLWALLGVCLSAESALGVPPAEISNRETAVTQAVKNEDLRNPYQISGQAIVLLLNKMVDFTMPGSNVVFERRTGQIFVKQTPANHAVIEEVLGDLRRAAFRQVEIEARFVTISSMDFQGSGIDFAGLNTALSHAGVVIGTAGLGTAVAPAAGTFLTGAQFPDVTGFGSSPLGQQLSFFGQTSKVDFRMIYDALETLGELNTLSAPKITVFNNQRAHIRIEKLENYVAEIDTKLSTSGTTGTPIAESEVDIRTARSGTILDVTPTINYNGTITLEVRPQFVTVDLTSSQSITNVTGGATFPNSVTLPVFKSQDINTTITVPDRGFAVMGGLIQDDENVTRQRVPFFAAIPGAGKMLSNEQIKRTKSYLVIFIQARQKGYAYREADL